MREYPQLVEQAGRVSTRRAMTIIRDQAKANAKEFDRKETPEKIYRNITIHEAKKRGKAEKSVIMRVGVLGGARKGGGDTWYWRLMEFGFTHKSGKRFRGYHFMLRAFTSKVGRVTNAMGEYMNKELNRYSKRASPQR